jgi:isopentenyldiphosphate isomerase
MSRNNSITQQNDPDELLEIFDASGMPTGRAKPRAAIHLDGEWHQAFHCWIVRPGPQIVLQRRAFTKDTFAGYWDAAAAGHWRFGESAAEAAREISEELGLATRFEDLRYSGRERLARTFSNGLIDREHHQVYVMLSAEPLAGYRPDPREVSAVAAFAARDLLRVLGGRLPVMRSVEAVETGGGPTEFEVTRDQVVPYSMARVRRIIRSARASC